MSSFVPLKIIVSLTGRSFRRFIALGGCFLKDPTKRVYAEHMDIQDPRVRGFKVPRFQGKVGSNCDLSRDVGKPRITSFRRPGGASTSLRIETFYNTILV